MINILIPTTKDRRARLAEALDMIRANTDYPYSVTIYENQDGGCVPATHKMLEGLKDETLVCVLNDDMWVTPGWLSALVKAYKGGLAYPDDGIRGEKLSTIFFCTVKYLKDNYHKGYMHSFADQELFDVAKERGELTYVPESKVNHRHFTRVNVVRDDTYKLQNLTIANDEQLYYQRKKK